MPGGGKSSGEASSGMDWTSSGSTGQTAPTTAGGSAGAFDAMIPSATLKAREPVCSQRCSSTFVFGRTQCGLSSRRVYRLGPEVWVERCLDWHHSRKYRMDCDNSNWTSLEVTASTVTVSCLNVCGVAQAPRRSLSL